MFLSKPRKIIKEIQGISISFTYPTISDGFLIEGKRNSLSRGQYPTLAMSPLQSQQVVLDNIDMMAELSICATFVDNEKKQYYWEGFIDDDGLAFIKECYDVFKEWRLSFRKESKEDSGDESK